MTTYLACERHPDRVATHHDGYTDEVLCAEHFEGEETPYEMEFVSSIPERISHWGRPTIEIEEVA